MIVEATVTAGTVATDVGVPVKEGSDPKGIGVTKEGKTCVARDGWA